MNPQTVRRASKPLKLIFWGAIICFVDFTVSGHSNGYGYKIDFINDVVGSAMIVVGVFRLGSLPVRAAYAPLMSFVQLATLADLALSIAACFIRPWSRETMTAFYGMAALVAAGTIAFTIAMRWFCEAANLNRAARSWAISTLLCLLFFAALGVFIAVYGIDPHGLATAFSQYAVSLIPLLVLAVVAIIQYLVSISRMQKAAVGELPPTAC